MKMAERLQDIIKNKRVEIILFIIVPFLFVLPYCFGDTLFLDVDGIQFFSTKKFYTETLLQGDFAYWNKYLMGGAPYETYGNFYPPAFLLSLLPMDVFVITYYCFHVALGAVFFDLYLQEIKCSRVVSFVVALLYECSIHLGGARKDHLVIITAIVYLPFILYFAQKFIFDRKFKWLILSALGMSMQCLIGGLQQAIYTDITVFFYILVLCIKEKHSIRKLCLNIICWIMTYIGFSMIYLFPEVMVTRQYSQGGLADNPFENFISYSIHFYKLLQMIFPGVFGNVYQAFGLFNSSEMDIELFLGILVLSVIIFTVIRYRNDTLVKLSVWIMIISYLYAAIGHIPILRNIVYKIPLLGGFRVPSRSLFIFIFFGFVLLAIGLTKLEKLQELQKYYLCFKKGFLILAVLIVVFTTSGCLYCHNRLDLSGSVFLEYCFKVFWCFLFIGILTWLLFNIILKNEKWKTGIKYRIFLIYMALITILEVLPYNLVSSVSNKDIFSATDYQTDVIQKSIGNYKIWDAFRGIDGVHRSIISQNMNIHKRIAAINAYVPFNNPSIYQLFTNGEYGRLNHSGLLTGSMIADQNLKVQNDMLSMLGIRYIIDSSGILSEDNRFIDRTKDGERILEEEIICIPGDMNDFFVYSQEIEIAPDTIYCIHFYATTEGGEENLIVDFFAGEQYDLTSAQAVCAVNNQEKEYKVYFSSGDTSAAEGPIQFRVFANSDVSIIVKDIMVSEIQLTEEATYELFIEDGGVPIYENKNANDILSVPTGVRQVQDRNTFFRNMYLYDLDDIAYVEEDLNYDINTNDIEISDIEFTNSRITATVSAKSSGFVMFAQCYYPGWNVYVNHEKVKLYQVSETIMGAELPPGEYVIEFVYTPIYLLCGMGITIITILIVIIYLWISRKKSVIMIGVYMISSRTQRINFSIYIMTGIGLSILVFLFYYHYTWFYRDYGDFLAHYNFAMQLPNLFCMPWKEFVATLEFPHILSYPVWHIIVLGIQWLLTWLFPNMNDSVLYSLVIAISNTFCILAAWIVTTEILKRWCTSINKQWIIPLLSMSTFLSGPLYVPWIIEDYYLGSVLSNPWHNPTTLVVKPLAILIFYIYVSVFDDYAKQKREKENKRLIYAALWLVLSGICKPSFFQMFVPALFIYCCIRLICSRGKDFLFLCKIGFSVIPVCILALIQMRLSFGGEGDGIGIGWMYVWKNFCQYPLLAAVLSIAFILAVYICINKEIIKNQMAQLGIITLLSGMLQFMLLYKKVAAFAGDFAWGAMLAIWIVNIVSIIQLLNIKTLRKSSMIICWTIYAFQFILGVMYMWSVAKYGIYRGPLRF